MDATDVMDLLRVDTLKSIAKRAGIAKSITRKTELIEALDRFLKSDPAGFVDRLGPIERNLLAEAVHHIPDTLDLTDEHERANPTDIRPIHVFSGERTVFFELRRMLQLVQGGKVRVQRH